MNTQDIKAELEQFIDENFAQADWEILRELSKIYLESFRSLDGVIPSSRYLNLDTVRTFMNAKSKRALTFGIIMEGVHHSVIASAVFGKRGGAPCQVTFKSLEGFIQACLCLRGPKAKLISLFAAKCSSMVVRLYTAVQEDLKKTEEELAKERAEVNRRLYLVIKGAVKEWRNAHGYRNTDFKWRKKHWGEIIGRLRGITYKKGKTPYVNQDYIENAKTAVKCFYGYCQRNPQAVYPPLEQSTIENYFGTVQQTANKFSKNDTNRCPSYIN